MARPLNRPGAVRVGVIRNPLSHRNSAGRNLAAEASAELLIAVADTTDGLEHALTAFAATGVELLVIDGGDGTVREVISRAPEVFGARMPRLTVLPSGKTNALALDLNEGQDWSLTAALSPGGGRIKTRRPLELWRPGAEGPELRGFILGTGAYVRAINLAQTTHRLGAFDNFAVGLTLAGAIGRAFFGSVRNPWRTGDPIGIQRAVPGAGDTLLLLASTLKRMPLGFTPFGPLRDGLKLLVVDAPARRLARALPIVISGRDAPWLADAGYRRADLDSFAIDVPGEIVLDGEIYPGGVLEVRTGPPLEFLVP